MRTYNEQVERDIRMVFDNDYSAYKKIASAARFFAFDTKINSWESIGGLADFIADMYYDRINAAADLIDAKHPQTVNNHISAMLIREVCCNLPTDVFRELAIHYISEFLEEIEYQHGADMRGSRSEGGQ